MYALLREIGIFSRNSLLPLNCVLRLYYYMRNLSESDVPICHWLMSSQSDSQHVPLLCGNLDYCAVCANGVYMYRSIQCTPRRTRVLFSHHSLTSTNSNYSRRSPKTRLLHVHTYVHIIPASCWKLDTVFCTHYMYILVILNAQKEKVWGGKLSRGLKGIYSWLYNVHTYSLWPARYYMKYIPCGYQVLTYWWCVHLKYPTVVHVCVCPLWFKHALELTETVNPDK